MDGSHSDSPRRSLFKVLLLLACLIFPAYSNTFHSPWILDDYQNILDDTSIHFTNLDGDSLWKPIKAAMLGERLNRPLARLTFALNWYCGGSETRGYHLVNISIHVLCAFFIFLTLMALQRTSKGHTGRCDPYLVSLLAAALWAVNPVQTQAVTYIVQRMAALASLFYVLGIYAYIQGRLSVSMAGRITGVGGCLACFFLGVASKENAVMLPLALGLVEVLFLQDNRPRMSQRRWWFFSIATVAAVVLLIGFWLVLPHRVFSVFNYDSRHFNLGERLLTQPRIILFYLSLLFYPTPFRLSFEHDVVLSTSFLQPWTTLPSIVILLALLILAVAKAKDWPYVSFAILFFFINHVVESSVIPLELVFEHRNYLPSMFLFVPIAYGLGCMLESYRKQKRGMHAVLSVFTALVITFLGIGTFVRNQAWESPYSLWADAARKAPASSRPLAYVALLQAQQPHGVDLALKLYAEALTRTKTNNFLEAEIYSNMAALYYAGGDFRHAVEFWGSAVKSRPGFLKAQYCLALASARLGRFEDALEHIQRVLAGDGGNLIARNLRGCIFYQQNHLEKALVDFKAVMKSEAHYLTGVVNAGAVYAASGHYEKAEAFFRSVPALSDYVRPVLLWRLKVSLLKGDPLTAENHLNRLAQQMTLEGIRQAMRSANRMTMDKDEVLRPGFDDEDAAVLHEFLSRRLLLATEVTHQGCRQKEPVTLGPVFGAPVRP
jgi:tetratricopeptide (TPR) repeat protein